MGSTVLVQCSAVQYSCSTVIRVGGGGGVNSVN